MGLCHFKAGFCLFMDYFCEEESIFAEQFLDFLIGFGEFILAKLHQNLGTFQLLGELVDVEFIVFLHRITLS